MAPSVRLFTQAVIYVDSKRLSSVQADNILLGCAIEGLYAPFAAPTSRRACIKKAMKLHNVMIHLRERFHSDAEQAFLAETRFFGLKAKYSDEEIGKCFPTLRSVASSPGTPTAATSPVPIDGEQAVSTPGGGTDMPDDDVSCHRYLKI